MSGGMPVSDGTPMEEGVDLSDVIDIPDDKPPEPKVSGEMLSDEQQSADQEMPPDEELPRPTLKCYHHCGFGAIRRSEDVYDHWRSADETLQNYLGDEAPSETFKTALRKIGVNHSKEQDTVQKREFSSWLFELTQDLHDDAHNLLGYTSTICKLAHILVLDVENGSPPNSLSELRKGIREGISGPEHIPRLPCMPGELHHVRQCHRDDPIFEKLLVCGRKFYDQHHDLLRVLPENSTTFACFKAPKPQLDEILSVSARLVQIYRDIATESQVILREATWVFKFYDLKSQWHRAQNTWLLENFKYQIEINGNRNLAHVKLWDDYPEPLVFVYEDKFDDRRSTEVWRVKEHGLLLTESETHPSRKYTHVPERLTLHNATMIARMNARDLPKRLSARITGTDIGAMGKRLHVMSYLNEIKFKGRRFRAAPGNSSRATAILKRNEQFYAIGSIDLVGRKFFAKKERRAQELAARDPRLAERAHRHAAVMLAIAEEARKVKSPAPAEEAREEGSPAPAEEAREEGSPAPAEETGQKSPERPPSPELKITGALRKEYQHLDKAPAPPMGVLRTSPESLSGDEAEAASVVAATPEVAARGSPPGGRGGRKKMSATLKGNLRSGVPGTSAGDPPRIATGSKKRKAPAPKGSVRRSARKTPLPPSQGDVVVDLASQPGVVVDLVSSPSSSGGEAAAEASAEFPRAAPAPTPETHPHLFEGIAAAAPTRETHPHLFEGISEAPQAGAADIRWDAAAATSKRELKRPPPITIPVTRRDIFGDSDSDSD